MGGWGWGWILSSFPQDVNRLHTSYWKDKFGTINGPDAYQKAVEYIAKYNKKMVKLLHPLNNSTIRMEQ